MWSDETAYIVEQESWGDPVNGQTVGFNHIDLMQFTGLKNKNGKEIYEGDILNVGTEHWVVSWDGDDAGFWLTQPAPQRGGRLNLGMRCDEGVVVGNVHENGDLLPEVQTNLAI